VSKMSYSKVYKMEKFKKEKREFEKQTKNYLKALADTGAPVQLIAAVQNIRDRGMTANAEEWAAGEYWEWWEKIRPRIYA